MPVDLIAHLKGGFSSIFTNSIIGDIIANPISLSFLIILVILMILWIVNGADSMSFKFGFYALLCTVGLLLLHQNIVKQRFKDLSETQISNNIIPQVSGMQGEIQPRPYDKIPDLTPNLNVGQVSAGGYKHFTGYNNMVSPAQIPQITSSEDLLRYVQNS